jgi:Tfp pilus assembly protein PilF
MALRIRAAFGCPLSAPALAALALALLVAVPRAEEDGETVSDSNSQATSASAPAPANPEFVRGIDAVLSRSYFGLDTSALLSKVREKLHWGEKDERLVEAEAVLLWDRGEWRAALIDLQRLSRPGPAALAMLGEGMERKQETYEAAAYYLEAARGFGANDSSSPAMFRKYLALRPNDAKVELEFAGRLESGKHYLEAADIYARRMDLLPTDAQTALRIGTIFTGLGRDKEALALYNRAKAANPSDRALAMRMADAHAAGGQKIEAAADMASAWEAAPSDTVSRNKAISILESMGPSGEAVLKTLLGKAVEHDGSAHELRFKLAEACLRSGDRDCAYGNLVLALKESPNNPAYIARLPDAIENDDQIKDQFYALKNMYETRGASMNLLQLVARGFSLMGEKDNACRAWYQLNGIAPKNLEGRRGPVADLAACSDPLYLSLAGRLADKLPAEQVDKEINRVIIQGAMLEGDFAKAAETARNLAAIPEEAPFVLQTAKDMIQRDRAAEAKIILTELSKKSPSSETYLLLGKILYAEKNYAEASDPLEAAAADFTDAERMLGECLVQLKDFAGAARIYESLWSRQGDKESLAALAGAYRQAGFGPKEKEILSTLVDKGWAGEAEMLRLGSLYALQGDTARAEAVFTDLLKSKAALPQEPDWIEAAFLVGDAQARAGKHDKAIRTLSLALKADSTRSRSWELLGDCFAAKLKWKDAFSAYAAGAALDKQSSDLARGELEAARKLGDKKALVQAYLDLSRLEASNDEASLFLAAHFQASREYRDAAVYYAKLAQAHPQDMKEWENLGNCLALIPDLAAAAEPLQKAIDLGSQSDEAFINRARAYRHEGAKDMASSILEFLLTRNPRGYLALLWSAKFAEEDGQQQAALELFKKAARQSPPITAWPELASQGMQEAQASAPVP